MTVTGTSITLTDNDTKGVTVSPTELSVSENGGTGTYTVVLTSQPTAEVTVTVTSGDDEAAKVSVGEGTPADTLDLTFTTSNWNSAQTVTVTGVNDDLDNSDNKRTVTVSHTVKGGDYEGLSADSVTVTVNDDNWTGTFDLSVNPATVAENVSEAREITVTATISGSTFPMPKTISVQVGKSGDSAVEGTDYATVADFDITIPADETSATGTFSLDPTDDSLVEGAETLSVAGAPTGMTVNGTTLEITDDDTASLVVDPASLTVPEGSTAGYTVKLSAQPSGDVTVAVTGGGNGLTANKSSLTFTAETWSTAQTVTVSAAEDGDLDSETAAFTHTASGGGYDGQTAAVTAASADNDSAPVQLSVNVDKVDESASPREVTLTATIAGKWPYGNDKTVMVAVGDQSDDAEEGVDYEEVSDFEVMIPAGDMSATGTFMLTPLNDELPESVEMVTVSGEITDTAVKPTEFGIMDDDKPPLTRLPTPKGYEGKARDEHTFRLAFDAVDGMTLENTQYRVNSLANDAGYGTWQTVVSPEEDVAGRVTVWTWSDLHAGTAYLAQIRVCPETISEERCSLPAGPATIVTRPVAPMSAAAEGLSHSELKLAWKITGNDIHHTHAGYELGYSMDINAETPANMLDPKAAPITVKDWMFGDMPADTPCKLFVRTWAAYSGADTEYTEWRSATAATMPGNRPPTVGPIADQSRLLDDAFSVEVHASDEDGDALTYSARSAHPGIVSLFPASPHPYQPGYKLKIEARAVGSTEITVTVEDEHGASASTTFMMTVIQPNRAPVIRPIADQERVVGSGAPPVAVKARDPDGDALQYRAEVDRPDIAGVMPSQLQNYKDGSGLTIEPLAAGSTRVTVTVEDAHGASASTTFTLTVIQPNRAPEIEPIADQERLVGSGAPPVAVKARDPDGDALQYQAAADNPDIAGVMPSQWMEYGDGSALSIEPLAAGSTRVTVTVKDKHGARASTTFTLTVIQPNRAPEIEPIADQERIVGSDPLSVTVTATDEDGDALRYRAGSGKPAIASVSPAALTDYGPDKGLSIEPHAVGSTEITVTVSDGEAATTISFTLAVTNRAPVLEAIGDRETEAGADPLQVRVKARDEDGHMLRYRAESSAPDVASVSPTALTALTGESGLAVTPLREGRAEITVLVQDGHGGEARGRFTVTVTPRPGSLRCLPCEIEPRHALSVIDTVSEMIADRIRDGSGKDALSLAGKTVRANAAPEEEPADLVESWRWPELEDEQSLQDEAVTIEELIRGSSFLLHFGGSGEDASGGAAVWGRGGWQALSNSSGGLVWKGSLRSALLGVDAAAGEQARTGLTLSLSRGSFDWRDEDASGDYRTEMTSLHPWIAWSPRGGVHVWASAGYGEGRIRIEEDGGQQESGTALSALSALSAGMSGEVLRRGGLSVALKGEALLGQVEVAGGKGIAPRTLEAQRVRVAAEIRDRRQFESGGSLEPVLEIGVRSDGGDAASGTGAELGAGLELVSGGLSLDLRARALLGGGAAEDQGAAAAFSWEGGDDGLGFSVQASSSWGESSRGMDRLWEGGVAGDRATELTGGAGAPASDAEIGYGFRLGSDVLTPYIGASSGGAATGRYRLGSRYSLAQGHESDIVIEETETGLSLRAGWHWRSSDSFRFGVGGEYSPSGHRVYFRGQLRW